MKEQFADYETSKMLKELGFDELTLAYTHKDGGKEMFSIDHSVEKYNSKKTKWFIAHPLWQQVEQWLWERYGMYITKIQILDDCVDVWIKDKNKEGVQKLYVRTFDPLSAKRQAMTQIVQHIHSKLTPNNP